MSIIIFQRLTDISHEWEYYRICCLVLDEVKLSVQPVYVIELQIHNIRCPHSG